MWLQKELTLLHGQFLTVRCEHYQICVKKSWSEFNQGIQLHPNWLNACNLRLPDLWTCLTMWYIDTFSWRFERLSHLYLSFNCSNFTVNWFFLVKSQKHWTRNVFRKKWYAAKLFMNTHSEAFINLKEEVPASLFKRRNRFIRSIIALKNRRVDNWDTYLLGSCALFYCLSNTDRGDIQWLRGQNVALFDRLEGVSKRSRVTNDWFTTIFSHLFGHLHNIFHKTEIQMVILRC